MGPAVCLVPCERVLVDAALGGDAALADALGCAVADGWLVFPASLERFSTRLAADPGAARWGPRFILVQSPRTVVGWGGFKAAPDADGTVEIGYAIAPAWEGRGVTTAAVAALLSEAWAVPGVRSVIAHTLAEHNASGRVLEKSGFARDGETLDGDVGVVWRYRRDRDPEGARSPAGARTAAPASG